ncbi:MAG TPA: DUF4097 family beta strand repeat-containing protein [Candidatus Eisenbacteria bacterium]|nr:DUF4097 family beta strand repeat-containing protein [Candidatus Eisenbacteria bacterium]
MNPTSRARSPFAPRLPAARIFALTLALALATILPSGLQASPCGEDTDRDTHFQFGGDRKGFTVREDVEKSVPAPDGTWSVEGGDNGSIELSGSGTGEASVCATIYAWGENEKAARALARLIKVVADERGVRSEGPSQGKRARWGVAFHIFLPRDTDVEVRTVNGPISVEGLRSRMDLETMNGPISITKSGGDVRGRTTNGPITVALDGSRWSGDGLDLESTNGPVTVTVPENFSAELEFGTTNGPMEFDFPITVQGRVSKTIKTTLGSGGPPIRVTTQNGPAILQRE